MYGIRYRMKVRITFYHDTLNGLPLINETWVDIKNNISRFENQTAVQTFLSVVKPEELNFSGSHVYSERIGPSRMGFQIESASFHFLHLKQQETIKHIREFLPKLKSSEWLNEFETKIGIGELYFSKDAVRFCEDASRLNLSNNVVYDYYKQQFISISLSDTISWVAFPMVNYAQEVVEKRLVSDSLACCSIGSLHRHTVFNLTTIPSLRTWQVRIILTCQKQTRPRTANFRILPDSTIDQFSIE
jgi:hypothetical protein